MSEPKKCLASYNPNDPKCKDCDQAEFCQEIRQNVRNAIISKLDGGMRQLLFGHMWTIGDSLASSPISDEIRIIMLCEAFFVTFGVTDGGKTGLVTPELYEQVREIHNDLTEYLRIMKEVLPKCDGRPKRFETLAEPTLTELEEKYSKRTKKRIYGEPHKVLRAIKNAFYSNDVYPKVIAQITQVASMSAGFGTPFQNTMVRFRSPQIDGGRRSG